LKSLIQAHFLLLIFLGDEIEFGSEETRKFQKMWGWTSLIVAQEKAKIQKKIKK
jgi:hypothetical protein